MDWSFQYLKTKNSGSSIHRKGAKNAKEIILFLNNSLRSLRLCGEMMFPDPSIVDFIQVFCCDDLV